MKIAVLTPFLAAAPFLLAAQDLPKPSPPGHVEQVVGLTNVTIDYSRPSARGRKVFGDLVRSDELWRTGANLCTLIEFDGDVRINGLNVPAGKYSLFTKPGEQIWMIYLNKRTDLWGTDEFNMDEVVVTTKAPVQKNAGLVETFTISIGDLVGDRARVYLAWEYINVSFEIEADATREALANIRAAVKDPKADYRTFHNCARFCLDRKLILQDALDWAANSVKLEEKYWNTYTYARLLAANDKIGDARTAAQRGMALAEQEAARDYVRMYRDLMEEWATGTK